MTTAFDHSPFAQAVWAGGAGPLTRRRGGDGVFTLDRSPKEGGGGPPKPTPPSKPAPSPKPTPPEWAPPDTYVAQTPRPGPISRARFLAEAKVHARSMSPGPHSRGSASYPPDTGIRPRSAVHRPLTTHIGPEARQARFNGLWRRGTVPATPFQDAPSRPEQPPIQLPEPLPPSAEPPLAELPDIEIIGTVPENCSVIILGDGMCRWMCVDADGNITSSFIDVCGAQDGRECTPEEQATAQEQCDRECAEGVTRPCDCWVDAQGKVRATPIGECEPPNVGVSSPW